MTEGLHPLVRDILIKRGYEKPEDVAAFLSPDYDKQLHDPFLMKGMKAAVERMVDLAEHSEDGKIAVGAARVMVAMRDANLRAIESLYKVERLEAGQTTENIGITAATQPVIETAKRISARAGVNAPAE